MAEEKTSIKQVAGLLEKQRQQSAYLIVISGRSQAFVGRMQKLEQPEMVLGRATDAHFQVEDDGISRKHAKVMKGINGEFQLVDLGSTNGTYLNGVRVNVATLADGDKIQIGSNTVIKFSIQDELEESYQRSIYESAIRDGLTRAYNKKFFLDALKKEFAYCLRHRVPLSLVMFDVDHFKKVNDTFGHIVGDMVLARLAQKLAETIRTEDVLARYGGEEFALLLRESAEDKAIVCAERCRKAVAGAEFNAGGTPLHVTVSAGIATLLDSDIANPEDLISAADQYLYRAKHGGRNRVESKSISG